MHHRSFRVSQTPLCAAALLLALTFFGCSSSLELSSKWTNQELQITGDQSHWKDATIDIAGPDVSVGVKNDNTNVYVCLITSNPATQLQILGLGCITWFDIGGKKERTFGIGFPVSGLLQGRRFPTRENPEELQRLIDVAQRQLEIRGPGEGERHRLSERDVPGIEVHLGYADGTLTYELKVPLQKSKEHPYAVQADMTKPLSVCFETGDLAEAMKGQPAVSNPSRNAGGGRGGRQVGGTGQGLAGDMPEPLKHWVTVHLANGSAAK